MMFAIVAAVMAPARAQKLPLSASGREPARAAVLTGTLLSQDLAVIQSKTVVLTNSNAHHAIFRVPVDSRGVYRAAVPAGTYQINLDPSRDLLHYRRADVNARTGEEYVVDLFPVQRSGTAMTLHGDVALPDPTVYYEQFPATENLNLLIRYATRSLTGPTITYQGGSLLLITFDTVTIAGDTIRFDPSTLVATVEQASLIDVGGKVTHSTITNSPQVELRVKQRMLRITSKNASEEQKF